MSLLEELCAALPGNDDFIALRPAFIMRQLGTAGSRSQALFHCRVRLPANCAVRAATGTCYCFVDRSSVWLCLWVHVGDALGPSWGCHGCCCI